MRGQLKLAEIVSAELFPIRYLKFYFAVGVVYEYLVKEELPHDAKNVDRNRGVRAGRAFDKRQVSIALLKLLIHFHKFWWSRNPSFRS